MKKIIMSLGFLIILISVYSQSKPMIDYSKERFDRIKKMTVRVFRDTIPVGTGFFVYDKSYIATCYHVLLNSNDNIFVELYDGTKYKATLPKFLLNTKRLEAEGYDYFILNVNIGKKVVPVLPIGDYDNCSEGTLVYLCGYPFGIGKPIVSVGYLSTKWVDTIKIQKDIKSNVFNKKVSWLDITMNSGNSGGPVLKFGNTPETDSIIGIAAFNLNPYSSIAESVFKEALNFPENNYIIVGVDMPKFYKLIYSAIMTNSVGVGGCISPEYIKNVLYK